MAAIDWTVSLTLPGGTVTTSRTDPPVSPATDDVIMLDPLTINQRTQDETYPAHWEAEEAQLVLSCRSPEVLSSLGATVGTRCSLTVTAHGYTLAALSPALVTGVDARIENLGEVQRISVTLSIVGPLAVLETYDVPTESLLWIYDYTSPIGGGSGEQWRFRSEMISSLTTPRSPRYTYIHPTAPEWSTPAIVGTSFLQADNALDAARRLAVNMAGVRRSTFPYVTSQPAVFTGEDDGTDMTLGTGRKWATRFLSAVENAQTYPVLDLRTSDADGGHVEYLGIPASGAATIGGLLIRPETLDTDGSELTGFTIPARFRIAGAKWAGSWDQREQSDMTRTARPPRGLTLGAGGTREVEIDGIVRVPNHWDDYADTDIPRDRRDIQRMLTQVAAAMNCGQFLDRGALTPPALRYSAKRSPHDQTSTAYQLNALSRLGTQVHTFSPRMEIGSSFTWSGVIVKYELTLTRGDTVASFRALPWRTDRPAGYWNSIEFRTYKSFFNMNAVTINSVRNVPLADMSSVWKINGA